MLCFFFYTNDIICKPQCINMHLVNVLCIYSKGAHTHTNCIAVMRYRIETLYERRYFLAQVPKYVNVNTCQSCATSGKRSVFLVFFFWPSRRNAYVRISPR